MPEGNPLPACRGLSVRVFPFCVLRTCEPFPLCLFTEGFHLALPFGPSLDPWPGISQAVSYGVSVSCKCAVFVTVQNYTRSELVHLFSPLGDSSPDFQKLYQHACTDLYLAEISRGTHCRSDSQCSCSSLLSRALPHKLQPHRPLMTLSSRSSQLKGNCQALLCVLSLIYDLETAPDRKLDSYRDYLIWFLSLRDGKSLFCTAWCPAFESCFANLFLFFPQPL